MKIRIGTRGSKLALKQAEEVAQRLKARLPRLRVEIVKITTTGDRIRGKPLTAVGGKGFFTKEIERALLDGEVDIAVHSAKDLPTVLPEGLVLAAITARLDPREVLISPLASDLRNLPEGSTIGTSSLRRKAQILMLRRDIAVVPMRGNLDTRLKKLREGRVDAIVVARAGLLRMGIKHEPQQVVPSDIILPAAGQGALAIEARADDESAREAATLVNDEDSFLCVQTERRFLLRLHGGCQIPVGVATSLSGDNFTISAVVASPDGRRVVRDGLSGARCESCALAEKLADRLLRKGAANLLTELREEEEKHQK